MKVEKIINTIQTEELEITGATLLSVEEIKELPIELRMYPKLWWTRSPAATKRVVCIGFLGCANLNGSYVYFEQSVRPALNINLTDSSLKVGDCFWFGGKQFEVVSNTIAFCRGSIGNYYFKTRWDVPDCTDYEQSDVKKFVDEWFKSKKRK